ncbi:hypothetical protein Glove_327g31 [Diversispora epigaea]|uniref:Prokaryotic-type class I peptide chain release factors domain-containing protein n=1 Tax=Diversispora epigaea TaxID=1348612 RepID=A0A397HL98_9GLOM|nr:hypothetical protein Glove_327g31 [Diversispora epigaea]
MSIITQIIRKVPFTLLIPTIRYDFYAITHFENVLPIKNLNKVNLVVNEVSKRKSSNVTPSIFDEKKYSQDSKDSKDSKDGKESKDSKDSEDNKGSKDEAGSKTEEMEDDSFNSIIDNINPNEANEEKNSIKKSKNKTRIEIKLDEKDLIESFVKGSGHGGQKINTTSNCVDLRHIPTGIRVQCQETRSLQQNRLIAKKILIKKLDDHFNGHLSKSAIKREKIKKREAKKRKRAREKYGGNETKETKET